MTGEFDFDDFMDPDEDDYEKELDKARGLAASNPGYDFYQEFSRLRQPKAEIGAYVAEQGFRVPLITDQAEWEKAFDDGTAMLRSEMQQDYDGLSGLLSSERLADAELTRHAEGYAKEFGSLVMRGLRSGELPGDEYMQHLRGYNSWSEEQKHILEVARIFNAYVFLEPATTSRWRYVEGTNVTAFADPNVEGRYHFGVRPSRTNSGRHQSVGGYRVDADEYDLPQTFRKHDQPFVARPFIEFYDQIASLPNFDNTQNPVLEMQQDLEGNMHFLQYLKTGQTRNFVEPFDLPSSDTTFRTTNVRGITHPEGRAMRMYLEPNRLVDGMENEAMLCGLVKPRGIQVQFAAQKVGFILHEAYISFQDNHFDSSPLFRPPLAAGMMDCQDSPKPVLERLDEILERDLMRHHFNVRTVPYMDIKVTSNGREAAIESDWDVRTIAYSDIK